MPSLFIANVLTFLLNERTDGEMIKAYRIPHFINCSTFLPSPRHPCSEVYGAHVQFPFSCLLYSETDQESQEPTALGSFGTTSSLHVAALFL